jgi:succinate-semialdehyde dehydrogenase/glutarate-semialdehyde dehydrogenase
MLIACALNCSYNRLKNRFLHQEHPMAVLSSSAEQITVSNPITGEALGSIPVTSAAQVRALVERARAAQPAWETRGTRERASLVSAWGDALWKDRENVMQLIRRETGKSKGSAYVELAVLDSVTQYYTRRGPRLLRPQTRRAAFPLIQRTRVYFKPHGVAGFITPWNYPLLNAFIDLVPALIAGNTAVLKPSEITPLTAEYVVRLMYRSGIPEDAVQIVNGDGRTGGALIDEVDYVAFTGSTSTGRKVAVRAAERLIPYSLELGGKDPLIVLNDADLDLAASGALMGAMENAGQTCISVERVYVEAAIYDAFVERIRHYAEQMKLGVEGDYETHVGSMTNERELQRTEAHVQDAIAKGARVLFGGRPRPDLGRLFHEPTVLVDVDHTMKIMQEETFGPLLPIMRVRDVDEAVRLANDNEYGLSACIYTRDLKRGEQIATRIESGDVSLNRPQMTFGTLDVPMGGVKHSGVGRRNGVEGLMRFVKPQSVVVDRAWLAQPALTQADPLTRWAVDIMRILRRWLPFL